MDFFSAELSLGKWVALGLFIALLLLACLLLMFFWVGPGRKPKPPVPDPVPSRKSEMNIHRSSIGPVQIKMLTRNSQSSHNFKNQSTAASRRSDIKARYGYLSHKTQQLATPGSKSLRKKSSKNLSLKRSSANLTNRSNMSRRGSKQSLKERKSKRSIRS